ncbi:hypothetical protein ACFW04_001261 [Cataglyphis niger]
MSLITLINKSKSGHCSQLHVDELPSRIMGHRHVEHSDLPCLERLICSTTYEIFGDVELEQLYETSCLSMIQYNERRDVVSGICLYNYPNIPSRILFNWHPFSKRIPTVTERNTMFVHLLVWDERYLNEFLKELLAAIFDITTFCQHVILVQSTTISSQTEDTEGRVSRFEWIENEEDYDDIITIIGGEDIYLRELYGDYYTSQMIRYPDGCRQLIIGEDADGSMAGVMCLNSTIDVNLLNENFELTPYNGLRKLDENDKAPTDVEATDLNEFLRSSVPSSESQDDRQQRFDPSLNDERSEIKLTQDKKNSEEKGQYSNMLQMQVIHDTLSTYRGEMNAFVLEILAMRDDMRPHWSYDFLEAAFECFPHLEYCAIVLPFSHPCQQFLQYFTRVPLRYNKDFPLALYIVHRASLREEIKCRRAQIQDRKSIQKLLVAVPNHDKVLADFDFAMNPSQLIDIDCFIFECNDTIIGLALLRLFDVYQYKDYVSMRSIPRDNYGRLLHFVLMPIFTAYHRFFFREIARLSELTVIFYRLHHEDECALTRMHPLVSCLDDMIPVDPRRQAEYRFPIISENVDSCENAAKAEENNKSRFSLFLTSPRMAMMPRVIIDVKIVIVGASDCGIAFAEYLAFRSMQHYVQFTNLTLISPHGIPFDNKLSRAGICLLPFKGKFCSEYRRSIFFYGCNIDCYCALAGLIKFGVNPSWITLIKPKSHNMHDNVFLSDCEVHETVMNAILQDEIQVLCEWTMIDWVLIKDDNGKLMIESITIEKEGEVKNLVCDALFNFYEKTINLNSFLAFTRAGLVFDGLLVINLECRTNDPFIFAAGTMTKYSRRFYSESRQHQYYNSVEIGERLAEILRRVIDIHRRGEQEEEKVHLTLPIFRKPIVIACILPGGYYYLHMHKPGKKTWDEMTSEDVKICSSKIIPTNNCIGVIDFDIAQGESLITGSCTSEIGYFRIGLSAYDSVETVTCFNRKIFQVQNMIALYGKHESMLNELKFRFQNSYISDFFAYFREPWAAAIFHDKFECLRVENRATLLSQMDFYGDSLIDDCINALIRSEWKAISEKDRRYIEYKYAGSIYHQELEDNLMNFLEFCEDDLPMYCTPNRQRQMYTDVEKSPLYFEQ